MIQRVNGSLAVSRALGDFDYKCVHGKGPTEQLVSPEPEVYAIERSEVEDEFIVLACDGIWDVMANEELCDFVRSRLEVTDDLERVCNEIVDTCLYKVRFVNLLFTESLTVKHLHAPECYHSHVDSQFQNFHNVLSHE